MKKTYLLIVLLMSIIPSFAQNKSLSSSKHQYTITATAYNNFGTITGAGVYNEGDTCVLTATPNEGREFVHWLESHTIVSNEPTYSFVVTEDRDLLATFATLRYTVTVSSTPANYGSVTGGNTFVYYGETCSLMAQFNDGYDFEKWTENEVTLSTNPVYQFIVTCDHNIKAHFFKRSYNVTASVDPEEAGIVEGGGIFTYGESCVLKTFPHNGYDFIGWKKNNNTLVSTDAIYVFDVTQSANYVASYEPKTYNVFVNANPSNGGFVSGSGSYPYNQECSVTATAAEGFQFVGWTENGDTISTSNSYTFTVQGNSNLVANFIPNIGVEEQQNSKLVVYPTPVTDKLTVEFEEEISHLEIFSLTGDVVYCQDVCGNKMSISMANLPNGIYFIKVQGKTVSTIKKFVKQ